MHARAVTDLHSVSQQQLVQAALVVHGAVDLLNRHGRVLARRLNKLGKQLLQSLQLDRVMHGRAALRHTNDDGSPAAVRPGLRVCVLSRRAFFRGPSCFCARRLSH